MFGVSERPSGFCRLITSLIVLQLVGALLVLAVEDELHETVEVLTEELNESGNNRTIGGFFNVFEIYFVNNETFKMNK